jgi:NAD(P)-dependent dehydrogenase (short-subunit alcohol dehydrogenase family)
MSSTVIITGAGRGIGLELARVYAKAGFSVIGCARLPTPALNDLAAAHDVRVEELEVTSSSSLARFCQRLGGAPVDILINNAGVIGGEHQSLTDMDYDAWREALEVNTIAPFRVTTALLANLERAQVAKVITLTSQMGSLARKSVGSFAYRSSKAAANKVMQVMAQELQGRGIVVCPVHPGWVRTDMGGAGAAISAEESAAGLFRLIGRLTMDDTGRFWTWDGQEHAW